MGRVAEHWIAIGGGLLLCGLGMKMLLGARTELARAEVARGVEQVRGVELARGLPSQVPRGEPSGASPTVPSEASLSDSLAFYDALSDPLSSTTAFEDALSSSSPNTSSSSSINGDSTNGDSASSPSTHWSMLQVAATIFTAEWGDRSQLALIALCSTEREQEGAILVGAVLAHAVCTAVACQFGGLMRRFVSGPAGMECRCPG